jgi:hypothetical protein
MSLTPEESHIRDKIKHSKRLADKNRFDHVKRTERVRRIFAQVRDHVRRLVGR